MPVVMVFIWLLLQVILHTEDPDYASYFLFYRWGAHAVLCSQLKVLHHTHVI